MNATPTMVQELCRELKLPTVGREAGRMAEEADRQGLPHLEFLFRLIEAELEERRQRRAQRRLKEAALPLVKTLESFDFSRNPALPEARIRRLAGGEYIDRAESIVLVGDPGTGKTHLATALAAAAAEQGRRVRFISAGRLANELAEARDALQLSRVIARYGRLELLVLDELGYLPLSKTDAELLFQVLSERTERGAIVVTTNLKFAEWTSIFPDPRLCRAVIDRLTHRAHVIDTGQDSERLREALGRGSAPPAEGPEATP